jgi:flagellar P-ring protein precursor FlgI
VDKPVNRIDLKEGATVEDLVQELQRTGAGARDVISILQAMKEAGALEADLEVLYTPGKELISWIFVAAWMA